MVILLKRLLMRFAMKRILKTLFKQGMEKMGGLPEGTATFSVVGILITLGGWLAANPEIVNLVPDEYKGLAVIVIGAVVGAARARSMYLSPKAPPQPPYQEAP